MLETQNLLQNVNRLRRGVDKTPPKTCFTSKKWWGLKQQVFTSIGGQVRKCFNSFLKSQAMVTLRPAAQPLNRIFCCLRSHANFCQADEA